MDVKGIMGVLMGVCLLLVPPARADEVPGAMEFELGRRYCEGAVLDYPKAVEHFEAAARAGNVHARYMLGMLVKQGAGVERDADAARAYFSTVVAPLTARAEQGDVLAQRFLGLMHQEGDGVAHSLERARGYFSLAAARGDAHSQLQLARYYVQGMGVKPDAREARRWYEQAAAQGLPDAQYELAMWLLAGDNVAADREAGLRWLAAAAKQKYPGVQVHPPRLSAKLMLEDSDGDGVLTPGEDGRLMVFVKNHGGPARDVRIFLESPEPLMLSEAGRALPLGDLMPGQLTEIPVGLRLAKGYQGPAELELQVVMTEARAEYETQVPLTLRLGEAP